jgi:hypothetical protein
MSINRGNQFDYLTSVSGPSRGLQRWQAEHLAADDPRRNERYVLGDVNATLIRTVLGQTIYVTHDTNLPRPYSRKYVLQGTRGLVEGYPQRVYVEGMSKAVDRWDRRRSGSRLTTTAVEEGQRAQREGRARRHGLAGRLAADQLPSRGTPTDQNVYDAAAISVVGRSPSSPTPREPPPQDSGLYPRALEDHGALGIITPP